MVAGIAAPRQDAERATHQRMRQVHEHGIATGQEHVQRSKLLDEGIGAEGQSWHRTRSAVGRGAAYGVVDDLLPPGEGGIRHAVEAALLGDLELWPAAGGRHGCLEGVAERRRVQVDLGGQRFQLSRCAVQRCCRIGGKERAPSRSVDTVVHVSPHRPGSSSPSIRRRCTARSSTSLTEPRSSRISSTLPMT